MNRLAQKAFTLIRSLHRKNLVRVQQGFTLIEMLVVISIIGILAVLVMANLNAARSRARDAARKSDIKNLSTALRIYYNDEGSYPTGGNGNGYLIKACDPGGNSNCAWGSTWSVGTTTYMQTVPNDPLSTQDYRYTMGTVADPADTDNFMLQACLENKSDTQGVASGGWCATGWMFQIKP